MQLKRLAVLALIAAGASPYLLGAARPGPTVIHVTDTVFVKAAPPSIDYDELARRVALRIGSASIAPTVIEGDLIVKGRLGVGGAPETGTDYPITVRAPKSALVRFISNESLTDPQREGTQHRHVGTVGVALDGGLRMDQNSTCYTDARGCVTEDFTRRRANTGFDSLGDMSFYLSDVDSVTGRPTAPLSQSLVFNLLDWDGNIHIRAHRPGQRVYFNSSTMLNAGDLQWEIPLR